MANGSVVTIGVFDGVHRGHQRLINRTVERAHERGEAAVVLTFDPNPLEVLRPDAAPTRLTSIDRRVELLLALGVDQVEVLGFTPDVAAMPAAVFVETVLQQRLNANAVVIGEGFRFGNRARGTAATLQEAGLQVEEFALVGEGTAVSSTRIRAAIAEGDVTAAADMLGRYPEVEGTVVSGARRGRELGYPTANVDHHRLASVPADGVYAGLTTVAGTTFAAAISVGTNPTFDGQTRTVESHLLDFDADLYGQSVRVEFVQRLRPMVQFAGLPELILQMAQDVAQTRALVAVL